MDTKVAEKDGVIAFLEAAAQQYANETAIAQAKLAECTVDLEVRRLARMAEAAEMLANFERENEESNAGAEDAGEGGAKGDSTVTVHAGPEDTGIAPSHRGILVAGILFSVTLLLLAGVGGALHRQTSALASSSASILIINSNSSPPAEAEQVTTQFVTQDSERVIANPMYADVDTIMADGLAP